MRVLIATDSPLVNTGYASAARITGREFKKRGHEVYFTHFNTDDISGKSYDYEGMSVLPNTALTRDINAIYGDARVVIGLDEQYHFDIILWINDSYRYRYINEFPQKLKDASIVWLPFEGLSPDVAGRETLNIVNSVQFVTEYAHKINSPMLENNTGFIYHGIDLDTFVPCPNKQEAKYNRVTSEGARPLHNKFIVGRVDRNQPRKRWDKTIEYFAEFAKDKNDVVLYAKCDPQDIVGPVHLDKLAAQYGVASKVFFDKTFYQESSLVKAVYDIMDFALSTTGGEGFGLFSAESMACGIPHAITKVAASPEILGDCGHLIDVGDMEWYAPLNTQHAIPDEKQTVDVLNRYYRDWKYDGSKLAKEMGARSRARSEKIFSFDTIYNKWNDVLQNAYELTNLVSIITPVYNELEFTQKYYESVKNYTSVPYEIIFVNNGSTDGTAEWLQEIQQADSRVQVINNETNLGFGKACNKGIAIAKGNYIAFVNNDCEVSGWQESGKCWMRVLLDTLHRTPDAGIVGPEIHRRDDVMKGFNSHYGYCILIPRHIIDEVGGFDENFKVAYYEDVDLSYRIQKAGYKLASIDFDEDGICQIPFHHFSGATNRNLDLSKEIEWNINYLKEQWGEDARAKIKILFHTFIGRGNGFSAIAEGLIPELADLGFDVYIHDWDNGKNIENPVIQQLYEKTRKKDINALTNDCINIVCFLMESYEHLKAPYKIGVAMAESTKMRSSYERACNSMNRILTFSNFSKNVHRSSGVAKPIHILRPGIDSKFSFVSRDPKTPFTVLNIGVAQSRKRSRDAVQAFSEQFPKDQYPDAKMIIKSSDFGTLEWVEKFKETANIEAIYTKVDKPMSTEEIVDLYEQADLLIHPSCGEGIGLPILEAMATGMPVAYTNWSAPSEYFTEAGHSFGFPIKVKEMAPAYTDAPDHVEGASGVWAMADIDHLKEIMAHAYENREELIENGTACSKYVAEHLTWKESALELLPLLFSMEEERKTQDWVIDFHPEIYKKPNITAIDENSRVTVDIGTCDRHDYLAALLQSLRTQTFKNWDLILMVDDRDESILQNNLLTGMFNMIGQEGHKNNIIRGVRQGPHIAHQRTLIANVNPLICRIDDDIILEPTFLAELFNQFLLDKENEIAGVGGILCNPQQPIEAQRVPDGYMNDINYQGKVEHCVMNLQVLRHPDNILKSVEHLYSSYMYRAEIAKSVGGFYQMASRIGHCEETDISYRMYMAGFKLLVNPLAHGYHFFAPRGGIRADQQYNEYNANSDKFLFEQRKTFWANPLYNPQKVKLQDWLDRPDAY